VLKFFQTKTLEILSIKHVYKTICVNLRAELSLAGLAVELPKEIPLLAADPLFVAELNVEAVSDFDCFADVPPNVSPKHKL
jgi:hypothetical protein